VDPLIMFSSTCCISTIWTCMNIWWRKAWLVIDT